VSNLFTKDLYALLKSRRDMQFKNFILDKFQEESIASVEQKHSVLVSAPTGSGKTLIADYIIDKDIKEDKRIIYTAPIKALSNQKFKDFIEQYGEDKIGLITGDVVINSGAQVLIMTTEVYRNMAIIKDPVLNKVSYCIMDEIHFISDEERGYIWEESIIFSPEHIRFLFLSATIPNAEEFASWVSTIKNHPVDVIRHEIRPVPLERKFYDPETGIATLKQIHERKELDRYPSYKHAMRGRYRHEKPPMPDFRDLIAELSKQEKLPCIYFVFSRSKTQEYAVKLAKSQTFVDNEDQRKISFETANEFGKLSKEFLSLRSVQELRQCLPRGIAFHNAGMLPDTKHIVEKLFAMGLIKVLFATETFAVGINMPAKTVCFDSLRKFTKMGFRYLTSKEYFQISGRAGRRGIDQSGLSVAVINRMNADFNKIDEITEKDVLPLKSQFKMTYNTILNMVNLHNEEEIQQILRMNFFTFQQLKGNNKRVLGSIKARFTKIVKTLTGLGYIKDNELTDIGRFTTKIFSRELEISQIFAGKFNYTLNEYSILLIIAALVYEKKGKVSFFKTFNKQMVSKIQHAVYENQVLRRDDWHQNLEPMTAIIDPCYNKGSFTEVMKNTDMLEGDLIRILTHVVDKLDQIDKAVGYNTELTMMLRNCKQIIKNTLEGIHMF